MHVEKFKTIVVIQRTLKLIELVYASYMDERFWSEFENLGLRVKLTSIGTR